MSTRRWYAPVLAAAVVTISVGAAYSFRSVQRWRLRPPAAGAGKSTPAASRPSSPAPIITQQGVPVASRPAATAVADAATVDAYVGEHAPAHPKSPPRPKWAPSDRQRLRDRVYLAGKENRPEDAIAALEAWDAQHPGDPEVLRELARLLARSPKSYDALTRYRELLVAQPDTSVRAEYAAALLAMQQYDSAAANYRILVAADSSSVAAHLGLARALSWGGRERQAEPDLSWLVARAPGDTTLITMLHIARGSYDPPAADAERWVSDDPRYAPYRLALARAYMRERHAPLAVAHFDSVLAWDSGAPLSLVREGASVHAAAGDSVGAARLLGRAVALAPRDSSVRTAYAEGLAWSGDKPAAIAQYDTLLMASPDANLLIARGRLHAWSGNSALAERDLISANELHEDAGTWVMLGDLYRWRSDRVRARDAYARANELRPGEPGALVGFASLAEAERREVAAILARDLGWSAYCTYLGDNQGFDLFSEGLSGAAAIGERSALTFGADARRLNSMNGEAARAGLVNYFGLLRFAGEGGVVRYSELGDFGFGSLSLAGPWGRTWVSSDVRMGPAYQSLMSAGRLTYTGASFALTVPVGLAALSAGVDEMWLNDGNARTSLQVGARYRLGYGVSALYSGGVIGFNHASESYWDPRRFTSHALGIEIATHADSGFNFSARVLPGIGLGTELRSGRSDPNERNAAQLSSGFAIDYRRRWWAVTLDGDYAKGVRESGYHSARAGLRVRITP